MSKPSYLSNSFVKLNSVDGQHKLFCFPHAGGSASYFRKWGTICEEMKIELIAIQLPGRGKRTGEQPLDNMECVMSQLVEELPSLLDERPFSFFGHSLGGMISYELCSQLSVNHQKIPNHLFLSSCRTPDTPSSVNKLYQLPDREFINKLKRLNGTPSEILDNPIFRALYLPLLRADFKLAETYRNTLKIPLPVNITCFYGDRDIVKRSDVLKWRDYSSLAYSHQMFNGDHFYLSKHVKEILKIVHGKIDLKIYETK